MLLLPPGFVLTRLHTGIHSVLASTSLEATDLLGLKLEPKSSPDGSSSTVVAGESGVFSG